MIYREGLGRPLTWAELDSNFKEVADTGTAAQTAASSAQASATTAASAQVSANTSATSAGESAVTAKAEADRAKQIAGLGTVADAIGVAALPFPDVWIPLSDSLRMLSGYGREAKIGDDVVARYATLTRNTTATFVNKSQALTNATINEARFERDGIKLEPMRTNVIKISEVYTPNPSGGVTSVSKTQIMGFNFVKQVNDGTGSGGSTTCSDTFDIKAGDTIVYHAVFKLPDSGEQAGRFRCRVGYEGGFAFDLSFYNELSNDREANTASNKTEKSQPYSDKTLVHVVRTFVTDRDYTGCFLQLQCLPVAGVVNVGCHQVELATYATSYVPTNGAAATRAADKVTIPRLNNDCVEWYSGAAPITPVVTADTITLAPPKGAQHLRNVRGFFTPLTPEQKKALK